MAVKSGNNSANWTPKNNGVHRWSWCYFHGRKASEQFLYKYEVNSSSVIGRHFVLSEVFRDTDCKVFIGFIRSLRSVRKSITQ